jgi:hypothetical protein
MCTPPKNNQQKSGSFQSYFGFLAEPIDQAADFTARFVPVSSADCDEELMDKLAAGSDVSTLVGAEVSAPINVTLP